MSLRTLVIAGFAAVFAACGTDRTASPNSIDAVGPGPLASVTGSCSNNGNGQADSHWQRDLTTQNNMFLCGQRIVVNNQAGLPLADVQGAVAIMNQFLANNNNLPYFATSGQPSDPVVTVVSAQSGANTCGSTTIQTRTITLVHSADTLCSYQGFLLSAVPGTSGGEVQKLLAHELEHALGFNGHWTTGPTVQQTNPYIGTCLNTISSNFHRPGGLNSFLCRHEKQFIYYAYGISTNNPVPSQYFVTEATEQPATLSLGIQANGTVSVSSIGVDQGGESPVQVAPTTAETFAWSLQNATPSNVVTLTANGAATTVQSGQLTGSASVVATLQSSTRYNVLWPGVAGAATVQVIGPPVTPSFTFSPSAPLTGQTVTFDASASSGTAPLSYQWTYGDGSPTTGWLTVPTSTHVYTTATTFTATLKVKDTYGTQATTTRQVPVAAPLAVSIHGMYANQSGSVKPNQTCSFRADATGGTGSYTYAWTKDGQAAGTTRLIDVAVGAVSFTLQVTVTSGSQNANASKTVGVSSSQGQVCS